MAYGAGRTSDAYAARPLLRTVEAMREELGDLWTYPADVRVITTNGDVKSNGELVMGRGVALQAKEKYPGIAGALGLLVQRCGNVPVGFHTKSAERIWTFPVKDHWNEPANLALISCSAKELVARANWLAAVLMKDDLVIALPRPGCGNGQRTWAEVKPLLTDLLDDRFVVLIWETTSNV